MVTGQPAAGGFFSIFDFCQQGLLGRWEGVFLEEETIIF